MTQSLQVGDEEGFLNYEEKVVFELQKLWRSKPQMDGCAVIGLCDQLDSLIYSDALKEYNLSTTANVWSKKECLVYYQDKTDQLIHNLETKDLNWKKLYDENRMNARHVLHTILKGDSDRRSRASDAYKAANRALMPKARRSAVNFDRDDDDGPVRRKSTGKPRVGKGKGAKGVQVQQVPSLASGLGLSSSVSYGAGLGDYVDGDALAVDAAEHTAGPSRGMEEAGLDLELGFDFSENPEGDDAWMDGI